MSGDHNMNQKQTSYLDKQSAQGKEQGMSGDHNAHQKQGMDTNLRLSVTEFEIVDPDMGDVIAKVKLDDCSSAIIELCSGGIHNLASWRMLSSMVEEALKQMKLDGDVE